MTSNFSSVHNSDLADRENRKDGAINAMYIVQCNVWCMMYGTMELSIFDVDIYILNSSN